MAAEHWLERAKKAGVEPDVITFNAVISAAAKKCDLPAAERWSERVKKAGVEPNVITFSSSIGADASRATGWPQSSGLSGPRRRV